MMTPIRLTALAACAAGLSLTACSAGITNASHSPSASRTESTSSAPTSPSPSPSASSASSARAADAAYALNIHSPLRTFPVPNGAQVIYNITCNKETIIELSGITVSHVSSFYNAVLPENGYKITGNTLLSNGPNGFPGPAAAISFTGHGYKGTISALSGAGSGAATVGVSASGVPVHMTGNLTTIDLTSPGATGCSTTAP